METIIVGILLLAVGLASAFAGYALFRIILPFLGFFAGFSIGFAAVQGLFGANVWSFVAALLTALLIGGLLALLSYFYYTVGVMILAGSLLAGAFAYLGQAVGLSEDGFVLSLLTLTGAIIGGILVLKYGLQHGFIVYLTAMFGVGLLLIGTFLLAGGLTLGDLHEIGLVNAIRDTVSSSWLWLIVWVGGTVFAASLQAALIARAIFGDQYVIEETRK